MTRHIIHQVTVNKTNVVLLSADQIVEVFEFAQAMSGIDRDAALEAEVVRRIRAGEFEIHSRVLAVISSPPKRRRPTDGIVPGADFVVEILDKVAAEMATI